MARMKRAVDVELPFETRVLGHRRQPRPPRRRPPQRNLLGSVRDASSGAGDCILPAVSLDLSEAAVIWGEEVRIFAASLPQVLLVVRLVAAHAAPMQHFLNFFPLPHGQSSFGPSLGVSRRKDFLGNAGLP